MTAATTSVQPGLGRNFSVVAIGAIALGVLAFGSGLLLGEAPRSIGALMASWIFFAGAAAGALAFRAFFQIVDAKWARPLASIAIAQTAFAPAAIGVLLVILIGVGVTPILHANEGVWLRTPFVVVRELVLTGGLFGFAWLKLRAKPSATSAVVYCLLFAIVLSVWAFDFVLGPDATFQSTIIGPYVFMSSFAAGTGFLTLAALRSGKLTERQRRDLGAFLVALSIFWGYMFWSQYLPIWYGNLPEEVTYALARSAAGVIVVVLCVFAAPFAFLLHPKGRTTPRILATLVVVQLFGFWLNCQMLVVPSIASGATVGVRDVLIALGMLGAFALSWSRSPSSANA
jgi:hypothetical protein